MFLIFLLIAPAVNAGTIRHDVPASDYDAIGAVFQQSVGRFSVGSGAGRSSGSGTLIAPGWVLTAAHVVDDASTLDYSLNGSTYGVRQWLVPVGWKGDPFGGQDVALVQLATDAAADTPLPLYRGDAEVGRVGVSVGYGLSGNGFTGYRPDSPLSLRGGTNQIDATHDSDVLLTDFDSPLASRYFNTLGYPDPTAYEIALAPGDSGGALLIRDGDGWTLAGVNSFGVGLDGEPDSSYGDISGYTRVSSHQHWIDLILNHGPGPAAAATDEGSNTRSIVRRFTAIRSAPQPTALALALFLLLANRLRRTRPGAPLG